MSDRDEIRLTLPPEREFQGIAHLVLGGVALRHELTIETLEDLQLAVGAVLDRVEPGTAPTLALSVSEEGVEAWIEPVRLDGELDHEPAAGEETLTLGRVLRTVVDEVTVEGERVRLTKRAGAGVR